MSINVKTDYGVKGNGKDDSGAIQQAINAAPAGSVLYFPATAENEYLVYHTLQLTKSVKIVADRGVRLKNSTGGTLFKCTPTVNGAFYDFEGLTIASGATAIHISSSTVTLSDGLCNVLDCHFETTDKAVYQQAPEARLRFEGCHVHSGTMGVQVESTGNYNLVHIENSLVTNQNAAGIRISAATTASGSTYLSNVSLLSNATALDLNNVTGSARVLRLASNTAGIVFSGSSAAASFSTGSVLT